MSVELNESAFYINLLLDDRLTQRQVVSLLFTIEEIQLKAIIQIFYNFRSGGYRISKQAQSLFEKHTGVINELITSGNPISVLRSNVSIILRILNSIKSPVKKLTSL